MTINTLLNKIISVILQPIVVLMFVVALMVFFWGIVQFINTSNTDDGREKGKRNILWGVVGMFIMFSVYGIIHIILQTFGIPSPSYL
ncbi:MAG: hypothetical protein U0522_02190 [Candidatus Paceibacterota bacterium]